MKINKDSLKAKANSLAKELNISQNVIYNRFFYDAFLTRLSRSKYRDKFILKGGLYLSCVFGVETRSTMDIDFYLKDMNLQKDLLIKTINEVLSLDNDDGIAFELVNIGDIRREDQYGGFQITLLGKLENVRCQFGIDIATGDPIVPSEKNYDYKCLVTGDVLQMKAYSLETVVAEKLETILSRGLFNSRSKDYYDLYVLWGLQNSYLDKETLILAFKETCKYRKFEMNKNEAKELIEEIKDDSQINKRWVSYCNTVGYAKNLEFNLVIDKIIDLIDFVFC
jgi:predicted nucleotidyltransferase component of viral defense system